MRGWLAIGSASLTAVAGCCVQAVTTSTASAAAVCRSSPKPEAGYKGPRCRPGASLRLFVDGRPHPPAWSASLASSRLSGWTQRQASPGSIEQIRGPRAGTRHVARFVVKPGDVPVPGGERAEVAASTEATGGNEGAEAWYAWSTYFPSNFNPVPASTFNVFTQFHQLHATKDVCSPNVAFQVNTRVAPARIRLAVRGGSLNRTSCASQTVWSTDFMPLRSRRWLDFVFHVRWSADPTVGFVELSVNGRTVVPRVSLATLYRGQRVYAKQGLYRAPSAQTSRILHTGMTRFS